ncbi:AlpA family phage regulatory protein [Halieaceae bacterium IMCC14734]|uniref:AlpA family phage regulatory protein n=1 Tax=Candidatus Litorirhabdus singularis TaxID=2518993 RepID=A0ABT3TM22_9GAMM|nr:AlpA family phage regulatory protein [Candidatus Litorirhabdus singularis]
MTFLRLPEIVKRVGLCRSSIYAKMADGTFPLSVKLGGRSVAWRRVDVETWEADPLGYGGWRRG